MTNAWCSVTGVSIGKLHATVVVGHKIEANHDITCMFAAVLIHPKYC